MLKRFAAAAVRPAVGRVATFAPHQAFLRTPVRLAQLPTQIRFNSSRDIGKIDKPSYQLTFTCKACDHRSAHIVSKQAYHNGTVLVQCPSCKNRHLIADHLKIFTDNRTTLEDILATKGEQVKKYKLDVNQTGDFEWEPSSDDNADGAPPKLS